MVILIPAYEPDRRMLRLIDEIRLARPGYTIVVVNDGSGPEYDPIFAAAHDRGCVVISHHPNRGKGYALKSGFEHIAVNLTGENVVTADCDGQHSVADILSVADEIGRNPDSIVLGSRRFVGDVPARSRFGNAITRFVFSLSTGLRIGDTQTGLRGYPTDVLGWLGEIAGDRFEYELTVLLEARRSGVAIHEVPIDTIYLDGNRSSHFRPVVDSLRIYAPLLRFGVSSLAAFLLDFVLLFAVKAVTGSLSVAVVTARTCSATFNYVTNRNLVFRGGRATGVLGSATKYFSLAALVMAANYGLMHVLYEQVDTSLLIAKLTTEATLFGVSYTVQKRFIFAGRGATATTDSPTVARLELVAGRPHADC
jgi:putative flippase GtrA